jgi:lantibiotic modifying enzyme
MNWLGLQPVDGTPWMVLPMGAGLADGYLGVALFLAQLARLSGVSRYAEMARRAASSLPALLGVLDARPDLLATVGCGAAEGMAGISYALARMSTLLDDRALGEWADAAALLTTRLLATAPAGWPAVNRPGTARPATGTPATAGPTSGEQAAGGQATRGPAGREQATRGPSGGRQPAGERMASELVAASGWLDGLAGCLAAMTSVHTEIGSAAAAAAAAAAADQLAALVERTGGRCAAALQPVSPGFATGPAGVGWALARFGAAMDDPAYQEAGRRAVWCAAGPAAGGGGDGSPGWCRGTAGLLVARSCLGDTELRHAAQLLIQRPVLRDLSLCHGEAGITEALTMLTGAGLTPDPTARTALAPAGQSPTGQAGHGPAALPPPWRHRAGLMVGALGRHTRFCGTPGGVPTPGLLRGLAGVGYGLLRAGFTERVPSVLFLEPTPAAGEGGKPG